MKAASILDPLSNLPDAIAKLTAAVPRIAQAVAAASVDAWTPDYWPPVIATLQAVRFNWRIRFVRHESESIFFFIQISENDFVSLDATASVSLLGAWPLEPLEPLPQDIVRRIVYFPTFLNVAPSERFANTYKPDSGDVDQTVFFMLGPGGSNVLAVSNPELGKNALLRYSPNGIPGPTAKKKYPLQAFVDLSMTLRDWLAAGAKTGSPVEVTGPSAQPNPSQQILTSLVETYPRCVNAVRIDSGVIPPLDLCFRVNDYSVQLEMALAADGSLAERSEDEKARLGVQLTIGGTAPAIAQAIPATPNFIVSGELYDQIFDALGRPEEAEKLGEALGGEDTVVIMAFVDSARLRSAIFKIGGTNGSIKLLMVLSGEMQTFPEFVFASAVYDGQFDSFFAKAFPNDGSEVMVSFDDVGQLFLPMIAGIRVVTNELSRW